MFCVGNSLPLTSCVHLTVGQDVVTSSVVGKSPSDNSRVSRGVNTSSVHSCVRELDFAMEWVRFALIGTNPGFFSDHRAKVC